MNKHELPNEFRVAVNMSLTSIYPTASIETYNILNTESTNFVIRILIDDPSGACPKSMIVKQYQIMDNFSQNWAGLDFLTSINIEYPISPHFYGAHREHKFILLEDLSHLSPNIISISNADNIRNVHNFMRSMAYMHCESYCRTEIYLDILHKINPTLSPYIKYGSIPLNLDNLREYLPKMFPNILIPWTEIEYMLDANFKPGPFTSYIRCNFFPNHIYSVPDTHTILIPISNMVQ